MTPAALRLRVPAAIVAGILLLGSGLPLLSATPSSAAFAACADGKDNDADGHIDYPQDPECADIRDESEGSSGNGIFVRIDDKKETVRPGGSTTYFVTLSTERDEQQIVDVRLLIPHQTNIIEVSNGGTRSEEAVLWQKVTIQPGHAKQLNASVSIDPRAKHGLLLVAEASVDGNRDTDTTRVEGAGPARTPLTLAVSDKRSVAAPGDILTYRIIVDNKNGGDRTFRLSATLSPHTALLGASKDSKAIGRDVQWTNQYLAAGDSREYIVEAEVVRDAPENAPVQFHVHTEDSNASDTTTVQTFVGEGDLGLVLTDDRDYAAPGEEVTYAVLLDNRSDQLATGVEVHVVLPREMEFVAASDGGAWTGTDSRWVGMTVSPHGKRELFVTGRVRRDTGISTVLRATAQVRGHTAVDISEVSLNRDEYEAEEIDVEETGPLTLRKVASASEVRPGDTVSFTVMLRNRTGKVLHDLVIQDRIDTQWMWLEGETDAVVQGDKLLWKIDTLAPGQEWRTTYTVRVSAEAPHGETLKNVVTVTGNEIDDLSLTERITTTEIGVVTSMPATGVDAGTLFLGLSGLLSAAGTVVTRRKLI